jgi:hypothetical protein
MYRAAGFHEVSQADLAYEEPGFNSVIEYLDNEASRSKIVITSTKQGKILNDLFLKIHYLLNKHRAVFSLSVEAIYKMAMIRVVVDYETANHILVPFLEEHQKDVSEFDLQPKPKTDDVIVMVFINDVFDEIIPDETDFIFEPLDLEDMDDLFEGEQEDEDDFEYEDDTDNLLGDLHQESSENDYDEFEDDFEFPDDFGETKTNIRKVAYRSCHSACYLVNPKRLALSDKVFHNIQTILDVSNANYSIEIIDEGFCGFRTIQVETDVFNPNDCDKTIEIYREVVTCTDLIRQHVYNGKILMAFDFRDVYTNLDYDRKCGYIKFSDFIDFEVEDDSESDEED